MARGKNQTVKYVLISLLVLGLAYLYFHGQTEGFSNKVVVEYANLGTTRLDYSLPKNKFPAGATKLKDIKIYGYKNGSYSILALPKSLGDGEPRIEIEIKQGNTTINRKIYTQEFIQSRIPGGHVQGNPLPGNLTIWNKNSMKREGNRPLMNGVLAQGQNTTVSYSSIESINLKALQRSNLRAEVTEGNRKIEKTFTDIGLDLDNTKTPATNLKFEYYFE